MQPPKRIRRRPGRPKGSKNKKKGKPVTEDQIAEGILKSYDEPLPIPIDSPAHPLHNSPDTLTALAIKDLKEWLDHKIDQVLLANEFLKRAGPHPLGKRCFLAVVLPRSVFEETLVRRWSHCFDSVPLCR